MEQLEIKTPPRPTYSSIIDELSIEVGKLVFEWCNDGTPLERCIEDSRKILNVNRNSDGYELANEFEDEGYSSDSELVEILDDVDSLSYPLLKDKVKKWVSAYEIKPNVSIGKIVSFKYGHKVIEGEVMNCYPDTAEYVVWHPQCSATKGNGGSIIKFEDVTILEK